MFITPQRKEKFVLGTGDKAIFCYEHDNKVYASMMPLVMVVAGINFHNAKLACSDFEVRKAGVAFIYSRHADIITVDITNSEALNALHARLEQEKDCSYSRERLDAAVAELIEKMGELGKCEPVPEKEPKEIKAYSEINDQEKKVRIFLTDGIRTKMYLAVAFTGQSERELNKLCENTMNLVAMTGYDLG